MFLNNDINKNGVVVNYYVVAEYLLVEHYSLL